MTTVSLEFTPNPDTLKYSVDRVLLEQGAANFTSAAEAAAAPLAQRLFEIPGVAAVMIGKDFVTVTVADQGQMPKIHPEVMAAIPKHLDAGEPIVTDAWKDQDHTGDQDAISKQIIEILDTQIRPAVAMDGGDIVFDRFDQGIVYLQMKGACSGCPSSLATLKQGIETRLQQVIPEVVAVQAM